MRYGFFTKMPPLMRTFWILFGVASLVVLWTNSAEHLITGAQASTNSSPHGSPALSLERDYVSSASSTFTVTSTGDGSDNNHGDGICDDGSGACTLRAAIEEANALTGRDLIAFNIPVGDPGFVASTTSFTIRPATALPSVVEPVVIDGYTQSGSRPNSLPVGAGLNPVLKVELDGGDIGDPLIYGIDVIGGNTTVRGLAVNGFSSSAFRFVVVGGNVIEGNVIGTDVTQTQDKGNGGDGVSISISTLVDSNVIRFSGVEGLRLSGGSNTVTNNVITDNVSDGIETNGGTNTIGISGSGNIISGNQAGINDAGGTNSMYGNVITENYLGIRLQEGMNIVGGVAPGQGNLINNNTGYGIQIGGLVSANDIKANVVSNNGYVGISISAVDSDNTIGGSSIGEGNTITFNGSHGISIDDDSAVGDAILGNSIHSNVGLGIDLSSDGVTQNDVGDADTGSNNLQNFPVLTAAAFGLSTHVEGSLNSGLSATFTIEFFANSACDVSGYGEGERFLGSSVVMTDGSGNAGFSVQLSGSSSAVSSSQPR